MSKQNLLIIEDDTFLLQMYSTKLEKDGFVVLAATDGEKGLKMAKKSAPDLILLDLLLPKVDGFQVLEELKKDKATAKIPVLILSNLGQSSDIQRCLALGARDFLIKAHYVPSEVVNKIKEILDNS